MKTDESSIDKIFQNFMLKPNLSCTCLINISLYPKNHAQAYNSIHVRTTTCYIGIVFINLIKIILTFLEIKSAKQFLTLLG
ncbi:hypothetical protein CISIN_1g048374mg [Citrus sinensis]|uniref:Uncharacterized protein n=1 Tax=Citrus sinensis TaxID=2711 RepID=A0A067FK82_CITSI|nr:hypothetical protein CISIN_1g048374mg [Citrus sinensis]